MKTRIRFITDIFKIADKMNKTDDGMELLMLIDDAEKMYDKQFSDLLSEQQQPTEPNNKFDTKQLIIGDVSKQRELLIAYTEYLAQQDITTSTYWLEVYNVDAFLKSNL